jgi:aldehyde:ferredoxin oxidoreductase
MVDRSLEGNRRYRHDYVTAGSYGDQYLKGTLPVKNYTTNLWPHHEKFSGQYLREHFEFTRKACWSCKVACRGDLKVADGPYHDFKGKQPEYEQCSACSSQIGNTDPGAMVMLANFIDGLGVDNNEIGWVIGFAMECFEKGILTQSQLDNLDLKWGNVEAVIELLRKIAGRQGVGNLLAEGTKRAAETIGGEATKIAVYTLRGNSREATIIATLVGVLDTCLSNTGTIESAGGSMDTKIIGLPPVKNQFSPEEVSKINAQLNGRRIFEDAW